MLKQRVLSAFVIGPIVLGTLYLGGIWFFALLVLVSLLAGYEFYRLVSNIGYRPTLPFGLTLILLLLLDARYPAWSLGRASLALILLLSLTWQLFRKDSDQLLISWALMLAGAIYVGGLLSYFVLLRNLNQGLYWTALALFVTWSHDSGAYLAGRLAGHRPFFARISPHKTQEGAIGGVLSGLGATAILGPNLLKLSVAHSLTLGLLLVLAAIFGDLVESLIKRQVGAKDSGALIPGHGGMLDRVDSLLFAAVVTYYYAIWVVGID
ncbi:MAG: phosphatidate cytidylyltransferase [Anaerolineae bacterium]